MKDGESVTGYCARTMGIANRMRFHGEQMNDVVIIEKILCSLAPKYDYVVCSIEESKDIDALSLDELQSSLLASTFVESTNLRGRGKVEVEELELEAIEMKADSIKTSKVMMINQIFKAKNATGAISLVIIVLIVMSNCPKTKKSGRNLILQRRRK
ncbi:hypothetical protein ACOSQ2_021110 [Xanthoceras sorbifolium]